MNISTHSFVLDPHQWHQNIINQIHSQREIIQNLSNDKHSLIQTKLLLLKGIKQTLRIKLTQVTQQAEQLSTQNTQNTALTTLTSEKPYIAISNKSLKQVNEIQMNSMKKMQELINIKNSMRKERKKEFMLKSKHIQKDRSIQTVIIPNTKMISSVLVDCSMNQEQELNRNNNKTNKNNIKSTLEKTHLNNNKSHKINESILIKTSTKNYHHHQSIAKASYELIYKQQICQLLHPLIKQVRTIHSKNTFLIKTLKYGYKNQQELNIWLREIKLAYLSMQVNQQCKSLKISLEKSSSSGEKKQSQTTATPNKQQNIENPYQNKIDKIKDPSIKKNLMKNKISASFSQLSRQSPKNSQNLSRIFTNFNSNSLKNSQSKIFQNKSYCPIEKENDNFQQSNEGKSQQLQNSLTSNNLPSKKSGQLSNLSNLQNNEQNSDSRNMSNESKLIDNSSQYWRRYKIIQGSSISKKSSQKLSQIIPNYNFQEMQQKSNKFIQQQQHDIKYQEQKRRQIQNQQKHSEPQYKMQQDHKNEDQGDSEQQMQEWEIKLLQHRRLQNQQTINNPLSQSQHTIRQQPNFSKKIQNHSKNMNQIIPTFQSVRIQQNNNVQFKENPFSNNNKLSNKQQNPLLNSTNPFVVQQSNKQNSSIKFNSSYEQSQPSKLIGNNVKNSSSSFSSQQSGSFSSSSQIKAKKLISPLFQAPSLFKSQSNSSSIIIQNGLNKKEIPNPFAPREQKKSTFNPFESLNKPNQITFNQNNVKNPFEAPKENNQNVANIFGRKQQSSSSIPNCFQQQSSMNPFDNNSSFKQQKNPFDNLKGGSQVFNPFLGDRKSTIPF